MRYEKVIFRWKAIYLFVLLFEAINLNSSIALFIFTTYPRFIIDLISATGTDAVGISFSTIFPSSSIIGPEYRMPLAATF